MSVGSKYPNKIVLMHLKIGIVFAAAIDRDEVQELLFCDILTIAISDKEGYSDGKHMQISMRDGTEHLFKFKKIMKAQSAVKRLNWLKQEQKKQRS